MSNKIKSIRLTHNALDIAREMETLLFAARDRMESIKRSYQQIIDADRESTQKQLSDLWVELHMAAGLPVGDMGGWDLDARYLEHGIAFLTQEPKGEAEEGAPTVADAPASVIAEAADVVKH